METLADFEGSYTDEYVNVGPLRLHYLDWNPGAERHLVLLHGLNVQAHTWTPIAARLAATHHVVCLDLRGHGRSDWSRDGYYLRDFASDLLGLVDEIGLGSFGLIGHSLGSRVGTVFAGQHPERVEHLILSDTGPEFPPEAIEFANSVVSSAGGDVRGFADEGEAFDYYRGMHPEWQPIFWDLHVRHQLRRNWAAQLVFRADPDLYWLLGVAGREEDPLVWKMLERLTMPTLVLWGRRSPFLSEDIVSRMLERMPDGRTIRTDTGHYIPREAPEEFVRITSQFLSP